MPFSSALETFFLFDLKTQLELTLLETLFEVSSRRNLREITIFYSEVLTRKSINLMNDKIVADAALYFPSLYFFSKQNIIPRVFLTNIIITQKTWFSDFVLM